MKRSLILVILLLWAAGACSEDAPIQPPRLSSDGNTVMYPEALWDRGVEGETVIRVLVSETGRVDSVEVAESSGVEAFDSAAVEGARTMTFIPGRRGSEPIATWAEVPIQFHQNSTSIREASRSDD